MPTRGVEPRLRPYQGRVLPLNYEGEPRFRWGDLSPTPQEAAREPQCRPEESNLDHRITKAVSCHWTRKAWCGMRDSNPRLHVGNVPSCRWTNTTWRPREESNLGLALRRRASCPLDHEAIAERGGVEPPLTGLEPVALP